jgi:1-acyl-sn-glycerol-3-phosphate acyltransferase
MASIESCSMMSASMQPDTAAANKPIHFPTRVPKGSRLVAKIRYWWSWTVAGTLLLFVAAPALLFCWAVNRRMWIYPLARWGARLWLRASGARVKVRGAENIDPRRSYIFASNHRSYLDTATLFFYTGTKMGIVAKKELLKVPVLGQGMSFVNIIAIDRSNPERAVASMEHAAQVVKEGYSFGVFVEGTRARPGELLPFKKGAFHLALQTGCPIVPVAIRNTDWMMGKGSSYAFPGEIEMVLLPPIETEGLTVTELLRLTRVAVAGELAEGS